MKRTQRPKAEQPKGARTFCPRPKNQPADVPVPTHVSNARICLAVVSLFGIVLSACEKPVSPPITPEPTATPTPNQSRPPEATPTPEPSPESTPEPSPNPEPPPTASKPLAPEGVMYLREGISITTDDGIHRVVEGTEVKVIGEQDGMIEFRTSHGEVWKASESQLTNDLDERDAILRRRVADHGAVAAKAAHGKKLEAARKQEIIDLARESAQKRKDDQIKRLRANMAALSDRIDAAEEEIREKGAPRYSTYRYYDGTYWTYRTRKSVSASLGPDASQIDDLRETYRRMQAELRRLQEE